MSLISRCATSDNVHRHMLELVECKRVARHSHTHTNMHPYIYAGFTATFGLNPRLRLTQRIGRVTFDLLTWWKLSNALGIALGKSQLVVENGPIRKPECC